VAAGCCLGGRSFGPPDAVDGVEDEEESDGGQREGREDRVGEVAQDFALVEMRVPRFGPMLNAGSSPLLIQR
jgi:hypothetical protein